MIVFDRYEIAPGAYGQPEFEIPVSGMEETEETTAEDASETIPEETWTESAGFEDNFSVDQEAAAEFGRQIKEAAATRDLEALADLAAYPLYVGFAEGGESVESKEEFLAPGSGQDFYRGIDGVGGGRRREQPDAQHGRICPVRGERSP